MTPEDRSSDMQGSPRLPTNDSSHSTGPRGIKLTKAVETLGHTLQQLSLSAQYEDTPFTIEPVELTLQIAASRTGPGHTGIEWLVPSLDDDKAPYTRATQTLTIRFSPRTAAREHRLAKTQQLLTEEAESTDATTANRPHWDYQKLDDDKLNQVLEQHPAPNNIRFVRLCIYELPSSESPQQNSTGLPDEPRPTMQLIITREISKPSGSSKIAETIRDKGAETIAQVVATQADPTVSRDLSWWTTQDPGGFAAGTASVQGFQDSLHHYLVGTPIEEIAQQFGVPDSSVIGFVAEQIPIKGIDNFLDATKLGIEISGIVAGAISGVPVLTCASTKALTHDVIKHTVVAAIKKCINDGLEPSEPPDPKIVRTLDRAALTREELAAAKATFPPDMLGNTRESTGPQTAREQAAAPQQREAERVAVDQAAAEQRDQEKAAAPKAPGPTDSGNSS